MSKRLRDKTEGRERRSMTIDQFASAIGVSTTTVSRTLSGRGRISAATRQMVFERMRELGYTPNATAQRLVTGRTQTILLDCGNSELLADMFMIELVRGIQRALVQRRYGLLINAPSGDPLDSVTGGAVDGVILVGGDNASEEDSTPAQMAQAIAMRNVPAVIISHQEEVGSGIGSVVVGLETGAREVARLLVSQGHRNIAFISSNAPDNVFRHFQNELSLHGLSLPDSHVMVAGKTADNGAAAMTELMQRPNRPTAVFARTDTLAAGALRSAHRMGLRVPADVSIVGHDDVPFAELVEPPLTTVCVDCARLGEAAAELLLESLENPGETPPVRVVPTSLVIRDTVATL